MVAEQQPHINKKLIDILESVSDPEVPVLSILDLGVVRYADFEDDGKVSVKITPTYSGCPAMDVIGDDIEKALTEAGYKSKVKLILSPAWTTDWMSENGKRKLEEYGIAPPMDATGSSVFTARPIHWA